MFARTVVWQPTALELVKLSQPLAKIAQQEHIARFMARLRVLHVALELSLIHQAMVHAHCVTLVHTAHQLVSIPPVHHALQEHTVPAVDRLPVVYALSVV
jgi:hypothetical protein